MGGYEITLWFNNAPEVISDFLKLFDLIGREYFLLLIYPLVFWCINKSLGKRLLIITAISMFIGYMLKGYLPGVRPYSLVIEGGNKIIDKIGDLDEYPSPSVLLITLTAFWGLLSTYGKLKKSKLICYLVIILSGISRLVHGAIYWYEAIISILIGVGILALYSILEPKITKAYNEQYTVMQRIFVVTIASACAIVLGFIFNFETTLPPIALFLGCISGIILEKEYIRLTPNGTLEVRLLRYLIGVILLTFLYQFFNYVTYVTDYSLILVFTKYIVVGFTGTFLLPMLFIKLNLGNRLRL